MIEATVMEVRDIGVMLELTPDVPALLHIRNIQHSFVSVMCVLYTSGNTGNHLCYCNFLNLMI